MKPLVLSLAYICVLYMVAYGEVGRTRINRETVPGIAETGKAGIGKTGLLGVL